MFQKYDLVYVNLNPKKGHTQAGIRPCIVIQNNLFNSKSATLVVILLTSNLKKPFPSEFIIKSSKENGLKEDSRFLGTQIITIDKDFIVEKIGELEKIYYKEVKNAITITLDLDDDF
ncbi:MAG: type II toxin-antitoxin system PemK/MazF family toxin [Candidatus Gracilibacteria bacterium]|nr:type II toxin-antitoxin system PemK/MazF family toxin [Candidatus Gracilibacteria bacterium]